MKMFRNEESPQDYEDIPRYLDRRIKAEEDTLYQTRFRIYNRSIRLLKILKREKGKSRKKRKDLSNMIKELQEHIEEERRWLVKYVEDIANKF